MTIYLCDGCGAKSNVWAAIVHGHKCEVEGAAQTIEYIEPVNSDRVVHFAAARAVLEGESRRGKITPAVIDGLSFRGSPLVSTPTCDDGLNGTATRGRP